MWQASNPLAPLFVVVAELGSRPLLLPCTSFDNGEQQQSALKKSHEEDERRKNCNAFAVWHKYANVSVIIVATIAGDASVLWKQGERLIYADQTHVAKDFRASIVDNTSLILNGVDTQYTGMYQLKRLK